MINSDDRAALRVIKHGWKAIGEFDQISVHERAVSGLDRLCDVRYRAGREIVDDGHVVSSGDEGVHEMAAEKARAARHEDDGTRGAPGDPFGDIQTVTISL